MTQKRITRRGLLRGAAGTATALIATPLIVTSDALGNANRPPASERIVLGATGVGGRGQGDMRGFLGRSDVQVVAVCDVQARNRKSAKNHVDKKYGNKDCKDYVDFREVCLLYTSPSPRDPE